LVNLISRNPSVRDETLNLQQAADFLQMSAEALHHKAKSGETARRHTESYAQDAQIGLLTRPVCVSARP
jgi:hypothetical protein